MSVEKKILTLYTERKLQILFHSLSSSPAQEPGNKAMTEAAVYHAFSATIFCYHESMDCTRTQTIDFTFKNETVNETWSHPFLTCVALF